MDFAAIPRDSIERIEITRGNSGAVLYGDVADGQWYLGLMRDKTDIYSGYLWKCVTPKTWFEQKPCLCIDDVYFLWEHTNFANRDAVKYNLDSLTRKEVYIQSMHGDLVLLQKSSGAVEGTPSWSTEQFYDLLAGKSCDV